MNKMLAFAFSVLSEIIFVNSFLVPDGLIKVNTKVGDIVGFIDQVHVDRTPYQILKFLGIPYAEAPVGYLRFSKPVMKSMLPSPFQALHLGSICPQSTRRPDFNESEDCLYLNIYAPTDSNLPTSNSVSKSVMIWIHGGGFVSGSSSFYDASALSAFGDVIVVTINYRIGILGYFSTHDPNAPGNFGLWDQHLAIRWIKDNIQSFGGDVDKITIFGESAGGSSVIYQMLYPGNKGLFQRVIAASGTVAGWAIQHGNTNYDNSRQFAKDLGCNDTISLKILSCLRQKPEVEVMNLVQKYEVTINEVNRSWVPVYDGDFVVAPTADILQELQNETVLQSNYPNFRNIDLMMGANNFDGALYLPLMMFYINNTTPTSTSYNVTPEQLKDVIINRALQAWFGELPTQLASKLTYQEYTASLEPDDSVARLRTIVEIFTDSLLNAPTVSTLKSHSNHITNTYFYQFSTKPPVHLIPLPDDLDGEGVANHGDELLYIFGFAKSMEKTLPGINMSLINVTARDWNLSKAMMTMWTNFAKSGNPNMPVDVNQFYSARWPMFDRTMEKYLEISLEPTASSVKQRLAARKVEFWNHLLRDLQKFGKHHM